MHACTSFHPWKEAESRESVLAARTRSTIIRVPGWALWFFFRGKIFGTASSAGDMGTLMMLI
jgi:hypothetical protein